MSDTGTWIGVNDRGVLGATRKQQDDRDELGRAVASGFLGSLLSGWEDEGGPPHWRWADIPGIFRGLQVCFEEMR